jgi:hypothetical protein
LYLSGAVLVRITLRHLKVSSCSREEKNNPDWLTWVGAKLVQRLEMRGERGPSHHSPHIAGPCRLLTAQLACRLAPSWAGAHARDMSTAAVRHKLAQCSLIVAATARGWSRAAVKQGLSAARFLVSAQCKGLPWLLAATTREPSSATVRLRTAVPTSGTSSQLHAFAVRSHTLIFPC